MTPAAKLRADTDWHVPRLYDFAPELGITVLAANFSRYVIDANRPPDGQALYPGASNTELCPTTSFAHEPLYQPGQEPNPAMILARRRAFWEPYHTQLAETLRQIRAKHGYAILFDAHSIRSRVPRFFEGDLPDLNFGTNDGRSANAALVEHALRVAHESPYRTVLNGRFKGGYITRYYGQPDDHIHAIQLEIAQKTYMDEAPPFAYRDDLADKLRAVLMTILKSLLQWSGT